MKSYIGLFLLQLLDLVVVPVFRSTYQSRDDLGRTSLTRLMRLVCRVIN